MSYCKSPLCLRPVIGCILIMLVILSSIANSQEFRSSELDCLLLSLENNMQFRKVSNPCGWYSPDKISKIILIPMKEEVINAAIEYKAFEEKLSDSIKSVLRAESYDKYLNDSLRAFILIISNNQQFDHDDKYYFDNFQENLKVLNEKGREYRVLNFTRNFTECLNPGWNTGYVFFENFGQDINSSYSVHFSGYHIDCGSDTLTITDWALTFDETNVNFLALIKNGLSNDEIREKYIVSTYETVGLKDEDMYNILKITLKLL